MSAKKEWDRWMAHVRSHPRTSVKYACDLWADDAIKEQQATIEALEAENKTLREAALLAMRCKTLTEAAQAKAALTNALGKQEGE